MARADRPTASIPLLEPSDAAPVRGRTRLVTIGTIAAENAVGLPEQPDCVLRVPHNHPNDTYLSAAALIGLRTHRQPADGETVLASLRGALARATWDRDAARDVVLTPLGEDSHVRPLRIDRRTGQHLVHGVIVGKLQIPARHPPPAN